MLLMLAGLCWLAGSVRIPSLDNRADAYFESAIKQAGVAYASTRVVNGVVSTVKDSELHLNPGGVGISYAAGEILDPLDDMTERLSDMLVLAIASLGVQKLAMEIGVLLSFKVVAILLFLLLIPLWIGSRAGASAALLMKLIMLFALLRFLLPLCALVNDGLYVRYLQEPIEESRATLAIISPEEVHALGQFDLPREGGLLESLGRMGEYLGESAERVKKLFRRVLANLDALMGALVTLMTAYVAVFALQVLLLPLAMLYLMLKLTDCLFATAAVRVLQERVALEDERKMNPQPE